jgi:hypothetical protein
MDNYDAHTSTRAPTVRPVDPVDAFKLALDISLEYRHKYHILGNKLFLLRESRWE